MGSLLRKVLKINPGELKKVVLLFFYFFLVIATYYILKPARSSLFLSAYGPAKLPYIYLGNAGITLVVTLLYASLVRHVKKWHLSLITNLFFAFNLFLFWFCFRFFPSNQIAVYFYFWASNFNLIIVMQFWSIANDFYTPHKSKRLYGFIGSGGILGSILAGFVVTILAKKIGTENLLLVSAIMLLGVAIISHFAWVAHEVEKIKQEAGEFKESEIDEIVDTGLGGFNLIRKSYYLKLIAAIIICMTLVSTIVDYQFNTILANRYDKDTMTAFLGTFFSVMTFFSFLFQFFLTSKIHRGMGLMFSLLILPFASTLGALSFLFFPVFAFSVVIKFIDGSLGYSIQQASKEMLYLPTSREVKYQAKAFIDVFFYRFGDALAAILILVFKAYGVSLRSLSLLVAVIAVIWAVVIYRIKEEYIRSLRKILISRKSFANINYEEVIKEFVTEIRREDFRDKKDICEEIFREAKAYFICMILCQKAIYYQGQSASKVYLSLFESRLKIARRLFRLISFIHPQPDLYYAFHYLVEQNHEYDTLALELLDNIMAVPIKKRVLPFFDPDNTFEEKIAYGARYWKVTTEQLFRYLVKFSRLEDTATNQEELRQLADYHVPRQHQAV